ncbi:Uncharacterized protein TSPI_02021 [Trichinella spiralis]|uniref:TNFR-Cys domain-containing protein n=1 Tax=Trichinella spiralis TaxID=6334 RepID=A0ABR3K881_TRISP
MLRGFCRLFASSTWQIFGSDQRRRYSHFCPLPLPFELCRPLPGAVVQDPPEPGCGSRCDRCPAGQISSTDRRTCPSGSSLFGSVVVECLFLTNKHVQFDFSARLLKRLFIV